MERKAFIYLLFFMVGFMVTIVVIDTLKITGNYVWIPFICSTIVSSIAIMYTVEDVKLHEVVLAALASVILSFMIGITGAISSSLLFFTAVGSSVTGGLVTAQAQLYGLLALCASILPAVGFGSGVAVGLDSGPSASLIAASKIPLPRSRANTEDLLPEVLGGRRRRRRGGLRLQW